MNTMLCFSGGIASGKTTVASAVAAQLGVRCASFGKYVRREAEARGLGSERGDLQNLGEALIEELGWNRFCLSVLGAEEWEPGSSIVVEGIRHLSAFETLQLVALPAAAKLIFIETPHTVRESRLAARETPGVLLTDADAHSTEADVRSLLRDRADLVLDGTEDLTALVARVIETLAEGLLARA